jgi:hypothetical protein
MAVNGQSAAPRRQFRQGHCTRFIVCLISALLLVQISGSCIWAQGQQGPAVGDTFTSGAARIEVVAIPLGVESVVRVTPQALEKTAWFRLTVSTHVTTPLLTALDAAWRLSQLSGAADGADVRFGVRALDANGRVIRSIYLDRSGTRGYFNGERVHSSNSMKRWLLKYCGKIIDVTE